MCYNMASICAHTCWNNVFHGPFSTCEVVEIIARVDFWINILQYEGSCFHTTCSHADLTEHCYPLMIVCQLLTVRSQVPLLVSPQQQEPGQEQYLHGREVYPNRWINLKWLAESDSSWHCDMQLKVMQGSPSATLVNVKEQVDLLPPSLISGVVSSSILNLSCNKISRKIAVTCSAAWVKDDARRTMSCIMLL